MVRREKLLEQVLFERRVLLSCTASILIGIALWITAIFSDYWFMLDAGNDGIFITQTKRFFLHSHSGIFRFCRYTYTKDPAPDGSINNTSSAMPNERNILQTCQNSHMFSLDISKIDHDKSVDKTIIDYNRVEGTLAIITVVIMAMGLFFSCYTFKNTRYMFKRTAGGVHILSTACCFTVIQVLMNSINYERKYLPFVHPPGAVVSYGIGFILGWLVFLINVLSAFFFMLYSRKRKGKKAPNEEMAMADEPTFIGR